MGKSLLPEEVGGAYQVEQWHFHAWAKTLVEVLHEFKLRKSNAARKRRNQISDLESQDNPLTATGYSKMNYEQLRKNADNDLITENMSNEEYEALSIALWRKFSVEKWIEVTASDSAAARPAATPKNPSAPRIGSRTTNRRFRADPEFEVFA